MKNNEIWNLGYRRTTGVIPLDAKIAPGSRVTPEVLGKCPGHKNADGTWSGRGGTFIDLPPTTLAEAKKASHDGAYLGQFAQFNPGLDIDHDGDEQFARQVQDHAFEVFGDADVRWRKGSSRRLLIYACKAGDMPKRRIEYMMDGKRQAIELLGRGQYYNLSGMHKSGEPYRLSGLRKASEVTQITKEMADKFFADLVILIEMNGGEIVKQAGSSGTKHNRKGLDNEALWAPEPERVLSLLRAIPCNEETFETRDDFVQVLASIKGALGQARDEHWPEVLEWSLGYPGAEDHYVTKIWQSYKDVALGWSFLEAWGRSKGYDGETQHAFDDVAVASEKLPADHPMKQTGIERMLRSTVFVKDQGEYYDTGTGSAFNGRGLNARYTDAAEFGLSGPRSAEGIFQNHKDARKVDTLTSRPGDQLIVKESNECGVQVEAVNMWRPSSGRPKKDASDEDVAPWLDLVDKAFGRDKPEKEHFLNYGAFLLQRPGVKIGHALVLIGGQGTGKDTLLKPLFEAVGQHNVAPIDTNTLFASFNFYLRYSVVYVQEIMTNGRRDMYNHIKPFVSGQSTRLAERTVASTSCRTTRTGSSPRTTTTQ